MLLMSVRLRALGRFVKSAQRELAHLLSVMEVSGRSNQQPLAADQQTYFFAVVLTALVPEFWTVRAGGVTQPSSCLQSCWKGGHDSGLCRLHSWIWAVILGSKHCWTKISSCSVVDSVLIHLTRVDTHLFLSIWRTDLLIFSPFCRLTYLPAVSQPGRLRVELHFKHFIHARSRHRSDLLKMKQSCRISSKERNDGA